MCAIESFAHQVFLLQLSSAISSRDEACFKLERVEDVFEVVVFCCCGGGGDCGDSSDVNNDEALINIADSVS